jgi:AcrR family transcriptional regulator
MPQANIDRRSQRSRNLLLDALLELMIERGYERLTVQNLLDRAGVGRATFYAHFDGKDELLQASVARLHAWLRAEWRTAPAQPLAFTLPLFQHLASHRRIYQTTVVRENEVSVPRHIRSMLLELVREDLQSRNVQAGVPLQLAAQYVVGALWSTITWWMERDPELPPEAINKVFQRLTFPGLATLQNTGR